MPTWRFSAGMLGLTLACAVPAQGGIYSTTEPNEGVVNADDHRLFMASFNELRGIGRDPDPKAEPAPRPLSKRYLLLKALGAKDTPGNLTAEDRLNLGAGLIRLRMFDEAIKVMKPVENQDRGNFLLLSNLATAHHLSGQERRALDYLDQALSVWPAEWTTLPKARQDFLKEMGWNKAKYAFYRRAEELYRKFLRLRIREALKPPGKDLNQPKTVDSLFDDGGKPPRPLQFLGEGGAYEAGKIAKAERDKLPADAAQLVQQLMLWLASTQQEDFRLSWLLGELYNARGDAMAALTQLRDLEKRIYAAQELGQFPDLREHLRVLQEAPPPTPNQPPQPEQSSGPNPWQMLGVGFLGGLVVAFLAYNQMREWRRRRQRSLAP
jgi:tetratricopeptide (TPR) repeat protein